MLRVSVVTCIVLGAIFLAACSDNKATIGPTDEPMDTPAATEAPETSGPTDGPTDAPTATPSPSPEPTPELGSREAPVPVGVPVSYTDGWEITVVSVLPNANAAVAAENMFNDPPEADKQFFIATVSLTYSGDDASDTFYDGALEAVGPSNVGYSTSNRCGVIPDDLPSNEVFPGGTIQGNVCWEILSTDAGELLMYYDPISFGNVDRVYWSLTLP